MTDGPVASWLLVAGILSGTGKPLSALVEERIAAFPCSGELNRHVADPQAILRKVQARYASEALSRDETDGVSFEFSEWRFNLRLSNTEPLIRLNVESRGDSGLMTAKTRELLAMLDQGESATRVE